MIENKWGNGINGNAESWQRLDGLHGLPNVRKNILGLEFRRMKFRE